VPTVLVEVEVKVEREKERERAMVSAMTSRLRAPGYHESAATSSHNNALEARAAQAPAARARVKVS
jgi:hypothetical protein